MSIQVGSLEAAIGRGQYLQRISNETFRRYAEVGIWLLNTDIAYVGSMALYLFTSEGISKRTFGVNHPSKFPARRNSVIL